MIRNIARVVLGLVALAFCIFSPGVNWTGNFASAASQNLGKTQPKDREQFVPGRLLVKFRDSVSQEHVRGLYSAFGLRDESIIARSDVHVVALPASANEQAFESLLGSFPEVEFAELDRLVEPEEITPNDPMYADEWQLPRIAAPAAWASTTGSSSITIAILDTGVDGTHEDLAPKMVPGWNVYNNNSNASDVYGHGTKVAGTAAALSNNTQGVASVAWNCKIMPIRISDTSGNATYSAMASGLNWAADHGARVANISYIASTSSTVKSAAQYFQSKGGVVVSSVGNNSTFDSTSDNPYILTVSATDQTDTLSYFSNTGNNVDLAAPEGAYTTTMGGGYTYAGGTSIASPIVAGVAALVMSANPNLSGAQVQDILTKNADDLGAAGWDSSYGWGRVNASRSVAAATGGNVDLTPPSINFLSPVTGAVLSTNVSVQLSASDNVGIGSLTVTIDGQPAGTFSSGPYSLIWDTSSAANGTHTLSAVAKDTAGNAASTSVTVTVSNATLDTIAPVVTITSPTNGYKLGANLQVTVAASDNVGVVKNELYIDGKLAATSTTAPFTLKSATKKLGAGTHTIQCRAYDNAGNSSLSQQVGVYK